MHIYMVPDRVMEKGHLQEPFFFFLANDVRFVYSSVPRSIMHFGWKPF